jgi:mono/diheme cytochrome c family protein
MALVVGAAAVVIGSLAAYVAFAGDRPIRRPVAAMAAPRDAAHVARGRHLYERTLLCWSCHGMSGSRSPDEPQAGGREFDMTKIGPGFGYVYGSNLTSDVETGIGGWSDGEVVRAIREGLSRDGRLIFPVMAYQFYRGLSDDDALALVAYLRTLPPVRNHVPPRRLSFAAKALRAATLLKPESAVTRRLEAPTAGPTREYGEYLTWHASGCAECHTPRDPRTGTLDRTRPLAGGLFAFPEEGFETTGSNLTPDATTGIGAWTEDQFMTALQTGLRPDGRVMLPFMPWPSYARWTRDDLRAVWLYLRSLPPVPHQVPRSKLAGAAANGAAGRRGEGVYGAYCAACHGERGSVTPFTTAALAQVIRDMDDDLVASVVADGPPGAAMPGFGKTLSKQEIADVTAFIRSW